MVFLFVKNIYRHFFERFIQRNSLWPLKDTNDRISRYVSISLGIKYERSTLGSLLVKGKTDMS